MKLEVLYFIMSFFCSLKFAKINVEPKFWEVCMISKEHHQGRSNHNLGIQSITGYNGYWNIKVLFFFFFSPLANGGSSLHYGKWVLSLPCGSCSQWIIYQILTLTVWDFKSLLLGQERAKKCHFTQWSFRYHLNTTREGLGENWGFGCYCLRITCNVVKGKISGGNTSNFQCVSLSNRISY